MKLGKQLKTWGLAFLLIFVAVAGSACSKNGAEALGPDDFAGEELVADGETDVPAENEVVAPPVENPIDPDPANPANPVDPGNPDIPVDPGNPCAPTTCQAQGKDCGQIPDGCGGVLTCGTCQDPLTCGGSGVANVCGEDNSEPPAPVAPLEPATCYRYGFVSTRDGGFENVYFDDTCGFRLNLSGPINGIDLSGISGIDRRIPASGPRKFTENASQDNYYGALAFKPDGTQMVFGRAQYSDPAFFPDVFTGNPNSTASFLEYSVLNPDPLVFAWSPDGRKQAVIGYDDVVIGDDPLNDVIWVKEIYTYDPVTYHLTKIAANQSGSRDFEKVVWHPTRNKLLFSQKEGSGSYFIQVHNLSTQVMDNLFEYFGGSQLRLRGFQPAIKPDGETLAFVRVENGTRQIFQCTFRQRINSSNRLADTCENVQRLTFQGANDEPSWTPDGEFLFFTSTRDGYSAIYKMKADGSEQVRLSPEGISHRTPAVYPISHEQLI